ncbi:right-handed parallel beta-helix repeat-containing protein [Bacteroides sp.]
MKIPLFIFLLFTFSNVATVWAADKSQSSKTILITPPENGEYCNAAILRALEKVAGEKGHPTTVQLQLGRYVFGRNESIRQRYLISNTASEQEAPDQIKHIALQLKGLKNVTMDGNGSTLLMDGEMTSFIIDSCSNITLKNFQIDFVAPTQTEFEVVEQGKDAILAKVHPTSHYKVEDGTLIWYGNGWSFSEGIAQTYDRKKDITWRSWCPLEGLKKTTELKSGLLYMSYQEKPDTPPGMVFQMRDAIRDEVCGLIQYSRDIRLENIQIYYTGNFGIVSQYSENLTFEKLYFEPEPGSGRTNTGFADFLQVSGCKGKVLIQNSRFTGAHDDPINVHGTHLQVMEYLSDRKVKLGFMHPQTFGFQAFFPGDEVAFIHSNTLLPLDQSKVKKVTRVDDRQVIIEVDRPICEAVRNARQVAVENLTWTPKVTIRNNYFSRIPTRGILVTTRRKVIIEDNTFYRMQMSAILIADDARSWFESGPVADVTIRRNKFIECGEPVIHIAPENDVYAGAVHRNISVTENHFQVKGETIIKARSTEGLTFIGNLIGLPDESKQGAVVVLEQCEKVNVRDNRFYQRSPGL